jgi:hypothetical protein
MRKVSVGAIVLGLFLVLPVLAADHVIYNGIDTWRTPGGGFSSVDFSNTPIPAGFFCQSSEPFTGRIALQGVPIMTGIPGALGKTDTIVQRLDDAVFNKKGVAETRIQVRALNLQSIQPVKTSCGLFTAKVSLDGEQPITQMRIVRENARGGGFTAPLALNVKISFSPVGQPDAEPLEIRKNIRFPALSQRWVSPSAPVVPRQEGVLLVDTDGDRNPDTYLPGASNFFAGKAMTTNCNEIRPEPPTMECHDGDGCQHCVCYYY